MEGLKNAEEYLKEIFPEQESGFSFGSLDKVTQSYLKKCLQSYAEYYHKEKMVDEINDEIIAIRKILNGNIEQWKRESLSYRIEFLEIRKGKFI